MLKSYNPHMVYLMEIKLDGARMERVRRRYGFANRIDVAADGSTGSITLAWNWNDRLN